MDVIVERASLRGKRREPENVEAVA